MLGPLVPAQQSELLFTAYEGAGATATLALIHAAGHTGAYLEAEEERTVLQTSGGVTKFGGFNPGMIRRPPADHRPRPRTPRCSRSSGTPSPHRRLA
jgi:hypothetical protein